MKWALILLTAMFTQFAFGQTSGGASGGGSRLTEEERKANRIEKLRKKHEAWDSCFIVKPKGDTLYGKVEPRADQSSIGGNYPKDNTIVFAGREEKEESFFPYDLKELYLLNAAEEYQKYVAIDEYYEAEAYGALFRIVVDGKCKLLFKRTSGAIINPGSESAEIQGQYFIYYKKKLTLVNADGEAVDPTITISSPAFRKKCNQIFVACPTLIAQIQKQADDKFDLRAIVTRFNVCIAAKK